ncbi:MAG: hypothetical protein MJ223_02065 [Mycoplasmoidaceae bacterium]|nr:hypothetical protein [Mycoplasmoidaceae bacterium]
MFLFILLGLDYKQIIKGGRDAIKLLSSADLTKNSAFKYACYRHYFKTYQHYGIENFIVYDPGLQMICEV